MAQAPLTLTVPVGDRSYEILIGAGLLSRAGERIAACTRGRKALVVADANVMEPHGRVVLSQLRAAGYAVEELVVDAGEETKSVGWLARIWDRLGSMKLGRDGVVVAVGGGVVGDLVGFAAASWLRGVDFFQVPTTLLSMVDSSVGGKTGINHSTGKNLIGAFWQPRLVLADVDTLATLPRGERVSGMAEVIKYGVIRDAAFFAWLESHVEAVRDLDPVAVTRAIHESCRVKAEVVGADERETTGLREILNFGHTVGHAIENSAGYGAIRHGEAISIGMVVEGRLAFGRQPGWTPAEQGRLEALLQRAGLPLRVPASLGLTLAQVQDAARSDKKNRAGTVRYMVPTRLGEVVNTALTDHEVAPFLSEAGIDA
ncbi:3-dehydroquinate synthase [bacterium]|nr:3-dehydroquinate synthase [bacterium]